MDNGELLVAASTIWVVITAVLVMFMQAGFAFLEAGLTRMKNVGHIAAKNVLMFALASVVYFLVGFAIAFGDGGNGLFGGSGFIPTVDDMLSIGKAPFSWFGDTPAAAGYLFRSSTTRERSPGSRERSCSARESGSSARTASRMRYPATTWPTRRSACSSCGSVGSASTPARP